MIVTFLVGVRLLLTLLDNKHLITTAQREAERSAAILKSVAVGIVVTDVDGLVLFANPAARAILAPDDEDPTGQAWGEVAGADLAHLGALRSVIRSSCPRSIPDDRLVTRRGREFPAKCLISRSAVRARTPARW